MQELDRALVSVNISLLNDSERILNKKMEAPCNLQIKRNNWKESKAKHLSICSLNCFISYTQGIALSFQKSNLKIPHKTHYYHGNHLGILGETPILFNHEGLHLEKALDSTLSASIVEHASEATITMLFYHCLFLPTSSSRHIVSKVKVFKHLLETDLRSTLVICIISIHSNT